MRIGAVGLGRMGEPIARRLLGAGHMVTVFNRTASRADGLVELGATRAASPANVWASADACITMIADEAALRAVMLADDGLLGEGPPGRVVIDMSTVSVEASRAVAEAAKAAGIGYLRAPVSGNPSVVETGNLTIMASGDREVFERLEPALRDIGPHVFYIGEGEQSRVLKLALNLMIAGTAELMAEALVLGEANGLDRAVMLEVMGVSAMGSPFVKYKTAGLVADDYSATFTSSMMHKDVTLALDAGRAAGVPLPVTALVGGLLEDCMATGLGDIDVMALLPRLAREAGRASRQDTTAAVADASINVVGCRETHPATRSRHMPRKIVDTILPTTMVGSYPRPHWYTQQLLGRDVRVAFKEVSHEEAYHDATHAVLHDQEEAGLDIVTDGQMWYDDYVGVIGSFCWYMYERIGGFDEAREPHPSEATAESRDKTIELLADWGGVINSGPVTRGPIRLVDLYKVASRYTDKPIKCSVGAGPVNLAWHAYFQHYKDAKELCYALAPIFNAEMKDLVEAGATYLQLEDLGAWLPLFTGDEKDYEWISDVIGKCCEGVDAKIGWHFCFGNAWGNDILSANFPEGYQTVLPHLFDTPGIDEFVLDYANREMAGVEFLKNLPADKSVAVGVLDIRSMMIETPEQVAGRARKVLEHVPADRVTLSTDCGMKALPRMVAKMKLKALAEGAHIVREEIG